MDNKYKIIIGISVFVIISIIVYILFLKVENFTDLVGFGTGKNVLISDENGNITMYPLDNIGMGFRGINGDLHAEMTRVNGVIDALTKRVNTLYHWTDIKDVLLNDVFPNGNKYLRLGGDDEGKIERTHLRMLNGLYPLNIYNKTMGPGANVDSKDGGSIFTNGRGEVLTRARGRVENGVLGAQLMLEPW